MASIIYGSDFTKVTWYRPDAESPYLQDSSLVDPYPPPPDLYVNKVWDPVAVAYVRWSTYYIDSTGNEYDGPSLWSVVAASHCIESITYLRLEA